LGFLIIFPIFWYITVFFFFGFSAWNSYVIIVGSFFSVLFSLLYYYKILTAHEIKNLRTLPEFWIATGMLIFYMAALPYFGVLNFLIQYHLKVAENLLIVLQVLDTCMYIIFTYGFLCRILNTKKS
jgi:magnesium-transporting ATPase (P-type)